MKMVEQVFLLFLTVLSSYFDLRYRKIPNYLLLLALPAIVSRAYQGEVHDVLVIIVFTSMLHSLRISAVGWEEVMLNSPSPGSRF